MKNKMSNRRLYSETISALEEFTKKYAIQRGVRECADQ